ncbi:DUF2490 domain-containing protein [Legionella maioricensis]|uniref:DUF2490 domain-containing protein n=1 Tax=Legionella maioricensis TaxID=2896528 RepID=A0A9X2CY11_9GAMM|nr:DUF2490 domain-containing protein [Legionella maioricensis]MCL9682608.1 DUF2490 domain-containing protein [Legionella maioricensis]MCL9686145.1 DUF2490 domain-containing protein [Legionella maioricensis]
MANQILSRLVKITLVFFLSFGISPANSGASYTKGWTVATMTGPLTNSSAFKYYLEPQLRLIDDNYFFHQFLLLGGLGYQFNDNIALYAGPGWIVTKTPASVMVHENRYWEQLNWRILKKPGYNINSRTRLEERENVDESRMAIRLRQRMWLRIPFKIESKYSFSLYDEVFFNLNHPEWVSPYLFEQNRAFVGVAAQLSKSILIDIGYLNQYLRSTTQERDNVLILSFTISN